MMKKNYIAPAVEVVVFNTTTVLLSGSGYDALNNSYSDGAQLGRETDFNFDEE